MSLALYFTQIDPPASETVHRLRTAGVSSIHLPMRRWTHLDAEIPQDADCLAVTSKISARWLATRHPHENRRIYCVGASTAEILRTAGLHVQGRPARNAETLLQEIEPYPHIAVIGSKLMLPTLSEGLEKNGVHVTQVWVYQTEPITWQAPTQTHYMVYFQSPSSVSDYSAKQNQPPAIAAIGPSTKRLWTR